MRSSIFRPHLRIVSKANSPSNRRIHVITTALGSDRLCFFTSLLIEKPNMALEGERPKPFPSCKPSNTNSTPTAPSTQAASSEESKPTLLDETHLQKLPTRKSIGNNAQTEVQT